MSPESSTALHWHSTDNPDAATTLLDELPDDAVPEPVLVLCAVLSALSGKPVYPPEPGKSVEVTVTFTRRPKKVVA